MTQEDINDLCANNMPQWRKDQIHTEQTEQEIYDSGQRSRDKKIAELEKQRDEAVEALGKIKNYNGTQREEAVDSHMALKEIAEDFFSSINQGGSDEQV